MSYISYTKGLRGYQLVKIGRVYSQRFPRETDLPKAEYSARLMAIRVELYGPVS